MRDDVMDLPLPACQCVIAWEAERHVCEHCFENSVFTQASTCHRVTYNIVT